MIELSGGMIPKELYFEIYEYLSTGTICPIKSALPYVYDYAKMNVLSILHNNDGVEMYEIMERELYRRLRKIIKYRTYESLVDYFSNHKVDLDKYENRYYYMYDPPLYTCLLRVLDGRKNGLNLAKLLMKKGARNMYADIIDKLRGGIEKYRKQTGPNDGLRVSHLEENLKFVEENKHLFRYIKNS